MTQCPMTSECPMSKPQWPSGREAWPNTFAKEGKGQSALRASKRAVPVVGVSLTLAWLFCATGLAIDFSAPLQDVQVTVNGSQVTYQVFDPRRNIFAAGSANTPANYISIPSSTNGVVAWVTSGSSGSTVYYRI